MTIRAVFFDIYGTLLEVHPLPDRAAVEAGWEALWQKFFSAPRPLTYAQFEADATARIAREHTTGRARGIPHPEIEWPDIVFAILPAAKDLPAGPRGEFLLRLAGLPRTTRLSPGAADLLRRLAARGVPLGLASNAQAYTVRELGEALATRGLALGLFQPTLRFWSFENGFSKPDPHVFRLLTARLRQRGILTEEALMVGDRRDNDIEPARAAGFQTWHLHTTGDGLWPELAARHFA